MQLIMDTETSVDITDKMSTIEEPLDTNLKNPVECLKIEIANGIKDNIDTEINNLETALDVVNGESEKCVNDSSITLPAESIKLANEDGEENGKLDTTEDDEKQENNCSASNGNGVHTVTKADGDMEMSEDNSEKCQVVENSTKDDTNVLEDIVEDKNNTEDIVLDESNTDDIVLDESNTDDIVLDESNTDDIVLDESNTDDIVLDESNTEDIVLDARNTEDKVDNVDNDMEVNDIKEIDDNTVIQDDNIVIQESNAPEDKVGNVDNDVEVDAMKEIDNDIVNDNVLEEELKDTRSKDTECITSDLNEVISESEVETNVNTDKVATEINVEIANSETGEIEVAINTVNSLPQSTETDNIIADITNDIEMLDSKEEIKDKESAKTNDLEVEVTESENINETAAPEILATEIMKLNEQSVAIDTSNVLNIDKVDISHGSEKTTDEPEIQNDKTQTLEVSPQVTSTDDDINCKEVSECDIIETNDAEEILDVDEMVEDLNKVLKEMPEENKRQDLVPPIKAAETKTSTICKLSNTLDILSDDEEEPTTEPEKDVTVPSTTTEKQCINIEDDDDIMLIDEEDTDSKETKVEPVQPMDTDDKNDKKENALESTIDLASSATAEDKKVNETLENNQKDTSVPEINTENAATAEASETKPDEKQEKIEEPKKPLVADNFLKGCKKNLADMTRDELEEFCILKIVEGIVDRSYLGDIKSKLKAMTQSIDEYKKKAMMLTKQNRDLQLVLKSVQEEQKKKTDTPITPLKITRSVGMQVLMTDKPNIRKKGMNNLVVNSVNSANNKTPNRVPNPNQSPRPQKPTTNTQQIPVPRLVPANATIKSPNTQANANNTTPKTTNQGAINGMKVNPPAQKTAEKRTHSRMQSVTVDLTDDEPPAKVTPRNSPVPPVRLVSPQNLLTRPQFTQSINSPRKVYIPISGPQSQNIRPGQTIMLKSVPPPGQRLRGPSPHAARLPQNQVRMARVQNSRHPAPLPECMKQYQPLNWKALPPAPDLKLSKVENGIVISWKIEGYQEDSYEEIASYQLYAYQETSSPPSTSLWKKIGDVKALPLPMACTLTQFMAGFKYYFAVRAVDVRSRLGPFSLPGSILLLNKM